MLIPALVRRPLVVARFAAPVCLILVLAYYAAFPKIIYNTVASHRQSFAFPMTGTHQTSQRCNQTQDLSSDNPKRAGTHPIDELIVQAEQTFTAMMANETHSIEQAAAAYRARRGRHPPPGFDRWYAFATERKTIMVEQFWDQIYADLAPFWALPPDQLRRAAWDYDMTLNIRSGHASSSSSWFWAKIWLDLVQTIEHLLPDMDMPLNAMDEPRIIVPWEQMNKYMMTAATEATVMLPPEDVVDEFQSLDDSKQTTSRNALKLDKHWNRSAPYWENVRRACPPASPARLEPVQTDFDQQPIIATEYADLHTYKGYVVNSSLARDVCHQPDLQGLQGIFINPLSIRTTETLFPLFGGSKLSVNNEILLPAPVYWSGEARFSANGQQGAAWAHKAAAVVWRGVATGGRNRENNWRGFQRHRFIAMNNGSKLVQAQTVGAAAAPNFDLPSEGKGRSSSSLADLGEWIDSWSDCGFVDLFCADQKATRPKSCPYTDAHFALAEPVSLVQQFRYKYLPDLDGNSFSGRYLAFLRSTSLPIKATLFREWHDSRLIAWKHFVPMDNRYTDWYGIMEYFLGRAGEDDSGHDAEAESIAMGGKEWAEQVLRKEDMQVYTLRLLLEYARVTDDRRLRLGWVGDLVTPTAA